MVESLHTGRRNHEVGSRIENTTCPRQLSHCTWLLIIFFCYLLQSHLLVEETPLCFSKFAQNPLFTILFKQVARTACTHKVNHALPGSQEQGQMSGKIKKLLVFSFWNEQKYYQTHMDRTTLKNHLLPPLFPQSLRYFLLNIFPEREELQLLVTSANNSGHEFLSYSPGPCRDRWYSSFTVLHILTLQ